MTAANRLEKSLQDIRYGARVLIRRPGFALGVIFILALGIGTAIATFSVINSVILKPLPYGQADRAVMIWSSWKGFPETWVSYDEYEAYQADIDSFAEVGISYGPLTVTAGGDDEPESLQGAAITESLLRVLDVQPVIGRNFLAEEDRPGGDSVAIIGYDLWQRRFSADPEIVGATIDVDGSPTRVVGVLPADFRMPMDYGGESRTEVLQPLAADPMEYDAIPGEGFALAGGSHTFYAFARLAPGATVTEANAELDAFTERKRADGTYPASWDFRAHAESLPEQITGDMHSALWGLGVAVVVVLVIASANVAGLMLIRGEFRRHEFGIRTALGANRGALARQLLMESGLLAVVAGAIGVTIAWLALRGLRFVAPETLPRFGEIGIDGVALGFALGLSLLTAFLVGLVPAMQAVRAGPHEARYGAGTAPPAGRSVVNGRFALIVGEVALAVVLVASAGLMVRTVSNLMAIDPGFDSDRLVTVQLALPSSRYPTPESVSAFYRELQARVGTLPGVEAAGAVRILPLATDIGDMGVSIDGYQPAPGEQTAGEWQVVTPGYLQAMNVALQHGRYIEDSDTAEDPVIVINRAFAEKYFSDLDPVGRTVVVGSNTETRVVGVVADTHHNDLTSAVKPRFYIPHAVRAQRTMHLLAQTEADPKLLVNSIRNELHSLDARLALGDIRMMADIVLDATAQPRFVMLTLSGFGVLALVLGCAGIYAVLGYFVSRRTREIGIQMSLGAKRTAIFGNVLRQGLWLTSIGVVLGTLAALAATQFLQSLLVGVSAADPLTYLATALLFLTAGVLACLYPALRAMAVNPMEALRHE
ncbi:MAG: ABC transporter permease [Woeseia sp.]